MRVCLLNSQIATDVFIYSITVAREYFDCDKFIAPCSVRWKTTGKMENKQLRFPKQYNENDTFQSDYPRGARLRVLTGRIDHEATLRKRYYVRSCVSPSH